MKIGILMGYSTLKGYTLAEEMSIFFFLASKRFGLESEFHNWEMKMNVFWYNKHIFIWFILKRVNQSASLYPMHQEIYIPSIFPPGCHSLFRKLRTCQSHDRLVSYNIFSIYCIICIWQPPLLLLTIMSKLKIIVLCFHFLFHIPLPITHCWTQPVENF